MSAAEVPVENAPRDEAPPKGRPPWRPIETIASLVAAVRAARKHVLCQVTGKAANRPMCACAGCETRRQVNAALEQAGETP